MPAAGNQRDGQPVAITTSWGERGDVVFQKPPQMLGLPAVGIGQFPVLIDRLLDEGGLA